MSYTFIIFFLLNLNTSNKSNLFVIKSNRCCIACFQDIENAFKRYKIKNYRILISDQKSFLSNLEAKEKMSVIFPDSKIEQTSDPNLLYLQTPAIMIVSKNNGIKYDTIIIEYDKLFYKGILRYEKIKSINSKVK